MRADLCFAAITVEANHHPTNISLLTALQACTPVEDQQQRCPAGRQLPPPPHGAWVQEDVERLLSLEQEVVRLQQALQVLRLEFGSRNARAESLALRLREAESQAAVRRTTASGLATATCSSPFLCLWPQPWLSLTKE
jgi:hypothetical protein